MKRYLCLLCLLLFAAGCATTRNRREQFVESAAGLTETQRSAILEGNLTAGMTPAMVKASWGEPDDRISEVVDGREVSTWIYERVSESFVKLYRVRFADGQLRDVKLISARERLYSPYTRRYYWRYYPDVYW